MLTLTLTVFLSIFVFTVFGRMEIILLSIDRLGLYGRSHRFRNFLTKLITKQGVDFVSSLQVGQNIVLAIYAFAFICLFHRMEVQLPTLTQSPTINTIIFVLLEVVASFLLFMVLAELFKLIFKLKYFRSQELALPMLATYILFYPIVALCKWLASFIVPRMPKGSSGIDRTTKGKSSFYLAECLSDQPTDIGHKKDIQIFQNALDFSEVKLHECMVPRNEICSISETASLDELQALLMKSGFSRILVYRETKDNIIGYVSSKDLFKDFHDISSMLRPVDFVPETMPAPKQLAAFIKNKKSIAVVVDEFGGTAGLVTLEDVMEEIFGDIEDEHDSDNLIEKKITDNEFLFAGRLEVDYLNDQYGLSIPENSEYETLAGYIIYMYERLPSAGQELLLDDFDITVVKQSATRIELVKLKKRKGISKN